MKVNLNSFQSFLALVHEPMPAQACRNNALLLVNQNLISSRRKNSNVFLLKRMFRVGSVMRTGFRFEYLSSRPFKNVGALREQKRWFRETILLFGLTRKQKNFIKVGTITMWNHNNLNDCPKADRRRYGMARNR